MINGKKEIIGNYISIGLASELTGIGDSAIGIAMKLGNTAGIFDLDSQSFIKNFKGGTNSILPSKRYPMLHRVKWEQLEQENNVVVFQSNNQIYSRLHENPHHSEVETFNLIAYILLMDGTFEIINTFNNLTDAVSFTGLNRSNINRAVKNNLVTGFYDKISNSFVKLEKQRVKYLPNSIYPNIYKVYWVDSIDLIPDSHVPFDLKPVIAYVIKEESIEDVFYFVDFYAFEALNSSIQWNDVLYAIEKDATAGVVDIATGTLVKVKCSEILPSSEYPAYYRLHWKYGEQK